MKDMSFKDVMFNRHSIKNFKKGVKIPHDVMLQMLNDAASAPSSVNMQPWRCVVVESEEGKNKLHSLVRFNKRQNETSSAMICIFGDLKAYTNTEEITRRAVEAGYMSEDIRKNVLENFVPAHVVASRQSLSDIVKMDGALFAMQLMLVARTYGYETNPIGGFEHKEVQELCGLDLERYVPVMIIAIGESDYEYHPSIRLDAKEFTKFK